jgi:hypothetical protein
MDQREAISEEEVDSIKEVDLLHEVVVVITIIADNQIMDVEPNLLVDLHMEVQICPMKKRILMVPILMVDPIDLQIMVHKISIMMIKKIDF